MENNSIWKTTALAAMIIVMGPLLGYFTTSEYVRALGIDYIERGNQVRRHRDIIEGRAGNPWQYRVLAPYLINSAVKFFENFRISYSISSVFIFFRLIQDTFVMHLSYAYYRKLGLSLSYALIGMALLAWSISYSHYDSDLQFNTFFDVIFYLLAGLSILQGRFIWIFPITLLAAFNRETSILIPFLPLLVSVFALPKKSLRKEITVFSAAIVTYAAIFIGLRLTYGNQEVLIPYGRQPGLDLLQYNLFRAVTWQQLIATLSIIPIVAIIGYRKWPLQLRVFFWAIVPIWFVIHAVGAVMAEARLFLVPQAMVFIPGALLGLAQSHTSAFRRADHAHDKHDIH
ncbi:MAG: hypothetical protein HY809_02390 [Nitrospirae bacterium]|nr:hypothetical protein [Nitrospirota bacterium]